MVAVEDKRFYQHAGVDWQGTLPRAVSNSSGGAPGRLDDHPAVREELPDQRRRPERQGGQEQAQAQTVARKLKEARIAMQLEKKLSKDEILDRIPEHRRVPGQVDGIGAAAHAYFNTTPDKLTVPQSALLAGLVNNPVIYDPWKHPGGPLQRRNLVIQRMVENNALAADAAAKDEPLGVVQGGPASPSSNCIGAPDYAGFFCQYAGLPEQAGFTQDQIFTGGYTIKTTLDERPTTRRRSRGEPRAEDPDDVANTFDIIRPGKHRHEVVALAANRDHGQEPDQGRRRTHCRRASTTPAAPGPRTRSSPRPPRWRRESTGIYTLPSKPTPIPRTCSPVVATAAPRPGLR